MTRNEAEPIGSPAGPTPPSATRSSWTSPSIEAAARLERGAVNRAVGQAVFGDEPAFDDFDSRRAKWASILL